MSTYTTRPKVRYLCATEVAYKNRNSPGGNLFLTVRFSDDIVSFGPINIRVAVTRAFLNFTLDNCTMPLAGKLEDVWPAASKTTEVVHKQSSSAESSKDTVAAGGSISAIPSASLRGQRDTTSSKCSSMDVQATVTANYPHISWRGERGSPSLAFNSRPLKDFLSGTLLNNEIVGTVEPKSKYYGFGIELEIPRSGLLVETDDKFYSYPNKRGLLKIIAAIQLCRRPIPLYDSGIFDG